MSLGLAAAVALLRETMDTTIRGRDELLRITGIAPLALVPRIITTEELRLGRRRVRLALGSAAGSFCIALVVVHLFYRPLDVVWFSLLHRFGN